MSAEEEIRLILERIKMTIPIQDGEHPSGVLIRCDCCDELCDRDRMTSFDGGVLVVCDQCMLDQDAPSDN